MPESKILKSVQIFDFELAGVMPGNEAIKCLTVHEPNV